MITTKCGFTLKHYFDVLSEAKRLGYRIGRIRDLNALQRHKRFVMLRHDVDISLDYAHKLAVMEHKKGIRATYFVLPQNPHYNPFSNENVALMKEMTDMGHEIGLHYDPVVTRSSKELASRVDEMAAVLGGFAGQRIVSVSQHRPSIIKSIGMKRSKRYVDVRGSMVTGAATYISESGMNWREGCMCNHVGKIDRIHILTHAEWWIGNPESMEGALRRLEGSQLARSRRESRDLMAETRRYRAGLKRGDIS